jgi:hypothetical protein
MKRLAVAIVSAVLFAGSFVAPVGADGAPQHTHNLIVPGQAEPVIAAGFCQVAAHSGFHQFHDNVHIAEAGGVMAGSGQVSIASTNLC